MSLSSSNIDHISRESYQSNPMTRNSLNQSIGCTTSLRPSTFDIESSKKIYDLKNPSQSANDGINLEHVHEHIVSLFSWLGISVLDSSQVSTVSRWYSCFMGTSYFLALPYVWYISLLAGSAFILQVDGVTVDEIVIFFSFYTLGNFVPPLCYLWALSLHKNKSFQKMLLDLKGEWSSNWMAVNRRFKITLFQSVLCTIGYQLMYMYWLCTFPSFNSLHLGYKIWFIYLGVTFAARLLIVFGCYILFLVKCKIISMHIKRFSVMQSGTVNLDEAVSAHKEVAHELMHAMDGWNLVCVALFLLPVITLVIQILMIYVGLLSFEADYFFLLYELHYFCLAWFMVQTAARLSKKWSVALKQVPGKYLSKEVEYVDEHGVADTIRASVFVNNCAIEQQCFKMFDINIDVWLLYQFGSFLILACIYSARYIIW